MSNLIKILTNQVSFNPDLALKYGIQSACAIQIIIQDHFNEGFTEELLKYKLKEKYGDKLPTLTLVQLKEDGIIVKVNEDELISNTTLFKLNHDKLNIKKDDVISSFIIFDDYEFNELLNKWNNTVIRAKHGKPKSPSELKLLFLGRTLNKSMQALKFAYEQKYVTLNFDYEPKRNNSEGRDSGRVGTGRRFSSSEQTSEGVSERGKSFIEF